MEYRKKWSGSSSRYLEPIDIKGATISRATLHNIGFINQLDLEIGCNVEVIRSGEIIPRIVRRV